MVRTVSRAVVDFHKSMETIESPLEDSQKGLSDNFFLFIRPLKLNLHFKSQLLSWRIGLLYNQRLAGVVVRWRLDRIRLRRLVLLVGNDVDAFLCFHLIFGNIYDLTEAFVRRLQMLLQEGLVPKASTAVWALCDLKMDLVVPAERWLVSEWHKARTALVWLVSAMNERMFLQRWPITELFPAKLWNEKTTIEFQSLCNGKMACSLPQMWSLTPVCRFFTWCCIVYFCRKRLKQ